MNTENHYQETDLGNISLNPRGEYNPEESYEYLDLVVLEGGSYVCLAENGATITGISPESGKTTQYWQVITIPGSLTPEYIAMHDRVVNLSEQVEADAEEVRTAEQNVSGMELNVTQMQEQTRQSAEAAEQSKDSSAGYAASADSSRQAAEESEQNVNAQVSGFNNHVAEKTEEAENDIEAARIAANKAIIAQQEQSVNEVARAGIEAISTAQSAAQTATEKAQAADTSEKNAAASETAAKLSETNATKMAEQVAADKEQVANDRTAVENAKQEMTGSVAQIEQNTQGISELKGDLVKLTNVNIIPINPVVDTSFEVVNEITILYTGVVGKKYIVLFDENVVNNTAQIATQDTSTGSFVQRTSIVNNCASITLEHERMAMVLNGADPYNGKIAVVDITNNSNLENHLKNKGYDGIKNGYGDVYNTIDYLESNVNAILYGKEITPTIQKTYEQETFVHMGFITVGKEYVLILPTEGRGGIYVSLSDGITESSRYVPTGRYLNFVSDSTGLWIGQYGTGIVDGTFKLYDVTNNEDLKNTLFAYYDTVNKYYSFYGIKPYSLDIRQNKTKYTFKHIACLGDSITEQETWQLSLQQLIGADAIDNNGIGGTYISGTSQHAMWQDLRINDISNSSDTIIVMGGTNDGIGRFTIGNATIDNHDTNTFIGAYNVLLSKLFYKFNMSDGFYSDVDYSGITKSDKTTINIVIMTMPHSIDSEIDNAFVDYAEAIRKVGNLWSLNVVDLFANCGINRCNGSLYLKDTVHPNNLGGQKIAETIANYLISLYR